MNKFMEQPFLKKYQPILFKDFIIENDYIELLNMLIKTDSLNILFIGNTGSGKTSILDATIREYYNVTKIPKDNILYINNLHDQGISYYRNEVKTFCQIPSAISGKKKFIILDDIDSINDQSQQVFRNCIDKYSCNVNFMASCSNVQKVIESIQSRTTLIKIKTLDRKSLKIIITNIIKKEKITITNEAGDFILSICNNSVRLLINYMEKFKLLDKEITLDIAKNICTNISFFDFERYTNSWFIEKNIVNSKKTIDDIFKKGYSVLDILDSYFQFIKYTDVIPENIKYKVIKIICKYISLFHTQHEHSIELTFFTHDLIELE
jgi:DNA polymerase III delta prime subunit